MPFDFRSGHPGPRRGVRIAQAAVAVVLMGLLVSAKQTVPPTTQVPAPTTPTAPTTPQGPTTQPAPQAPVPGAPPAPTPVLPTAPVAPVLTRSFTTKTGLLFTAVRPERVIDFETVIGLLQDALAAATDPAVRAQAMGWRTFRATEPGPNGTVLYVSIVDPAVPGADYGLGRILSDAYPDRIQEIWKLYTGALAGGGSLLNLSPVEPPPPTPATPTIEGPTTAAPGGRGGAPAGRGAAPAGRGGTSPAGRGTTTPSRPGPPPQ